MIRYVAIVEGATERAYLQQLNAFLLQEMELDGNGFDAKIQFYPHLTNRTEGSGWFGLVKPALSREIGRGSGGNVAIIVDSDIYVRNANSQECSNSAAYAHKGDLPDFNFSLHNFEDFLALHFEDDLFEKWKGVFMARRHFDVPLQGREYASIWQSLWKKYLGWRPDLPSLPYKKGVIPRGFVTLESLANMIRHARDPLIRQVSESCRELTDLPLHVLMSTLLRKHYGRDFGPLLAKGDK